MVSRSTRWAIKNSDCILLFPEIRGMRKSRRNSRKLTEAWGWRTANWSNEKYIPRIFGYFFSGWSVGLFFFPWFFLSFSVWKGVAEVAGVTGVCDVCDLVPFSSKTGKYRQFRKCTSIWRVISPTAHRKGNCPPHFKEATFASGYRCRISSASVE